MSKPLEEQSDEELRGSLAKGELGEKKRVVAEEILRRRQQATAEKLTRKYKWFGSIAAGFSVLLLVLKRFWRR
jgi:hypothetical protein